MLECFKAETAVPTYQTCVLTTTTWRRQRRRVVETRSQRRQNETSSCQTSKPTTHRH